MQNATHAFSEHDFETYRYFPLVTDNRIWNVYKISISLRIVIL